MEEDENQHRHNNHHCHHHQHHRYERNDKSCDREGDHLVTKDQGALGAQKRLLRSTATNRKALMAKKLGRKVERRVTDQEQVRYKRWASAPRVLEVGKQTIVCFPS